MPKKEHKGQKMLTYTKSKNKDSKNSSQSEFHCFMETS
jgi:hypothetical protein